MWKCREYFQHSSKDKKNSKRTWRTVKISQSWSSRECRTQPRATPKEHWLIRTTLHPITRPRTKAARPSPVPLISPKPWVAPLETALQEGSKSQTWRLAPVDLRPSRTIKSTSTPTRRWWLAPDKSTRWRFLTLILLILILSVDPAIQRRDSLHPFIVIAPTKLPCSRRLQLEITRSTTRRQWKLTTRPDHTWCSLLRRSTDLRSIRLRLSIPQLVSQIAISYTWPWAINILHV